MNKREHDCIFEICRALEFMYGSKTGIIENENGVFVMSDGKAVSVLFTICETNKTVCIKLEEIYVEKGFRNKGLGTNTIKIIQGIVRKHRCIIGLWCDKNNKILNQWYKKLGFKFIEQLDDNWYEYKGADV